MFALAPVLSNVTVTAIRESGGRKRRAVRFQFAVDEVVSQLPLPPEPPPPVQVSAVLVIGVKTATAARFRPTLAFQFESIVNVVLPADRLAR